MKLLQTMAGGAVGGAEEFFVALATAFHDRGLDQRVAARPNPRRDGRLAAAGVPCLPLRFGGVLDRATAPRLADEIDRFAPDIVMSWMKRATAASVRAARRARRRPVCVGRLDGYYDLKYYAGCDHVIGVTPDIVAHAVRHGWPAERAHFAPNFPVHDSGARVSRPAFGAPEGAPSLLAAGRLHPNKGFDVLLRAFARLDERARLVVTGEGEERRALESLAAALGVAGRVRFPGWRGDIADLMASADIFVCPSRIEPFGIVVVEAWANRCPIAACAASGPAWLIDDGATGLLSPVDDAAALADSLAALIAGPALRARLAAAGRRRFESEFTARAVVARHEALFGDMLADRQSRPA